MTCRLPLMPRRACAAWLLAGLLVAADPPPVPDPYGLGERLALIDLLKADYGIVAAPGTTTGDLQRLYAAAWNARQHPDDERRDERERAARLRRRLADRFAVDPDPALDLAGLVALQQRLEAARADHDEAVIRRRLEEDPPPSAPSPSPASAPAVEERPSASAGVALPAAPRSAAPASGVKVRPLTLHVDGVAGVLLIDGPKQALCVQFGQERSTEFHGVFENLYALLIAGKGPPDAVFLLGHGSGVSINGAPIGPHLRANREFYETFGHTRPAKRLECLVIASCSRGSPVQMGAMRDGFGYYPTWRVATADRSYANAISVIAAFRAIADRTPQQEFRGIFRMGRDPDLVGSLGEVGVDGAKADMDYFDIGVEDGRIRATER